MSHTPGPWKWNRYSMEGAELEAVIKNGLQPVRLLTNDGSSPVMAEDKRVALVDCQTDYKRGQGHVTDCAERDANAQLIAAAPYLLAALDLIVTNCATGSVNQLCKADADRARAALAKARGK